MTIFIGCFFNEDNFPYEIKLKTVTDYGNGTLNAEKINQR